MPTPRTRPRQKRQLEVLLGGKLPAVTADVSVGGVCAELPQVFLPGSLIHGSVKLEDVDYPFIGQVAWAEPGNPMLSVNSRMGIRFIQISEAFMTQFRQSLKHRVAVSPARRKRSVRPAR